MVNIVILFAAVWILATISLILKNRRIEKKLRAQASTIRELLRTIDKLKSQNGKLWYETYTEDLKKNTGAGGDLTATSL